MTVRFFDIEWDFDDLSSRERKEMKYALPTFFDIEVSDDTDLNEEGADIISDEYGFLVKSFDYDIL